jgi:hypothetical protein
MINAALSPSARDLPDRVAACARTCVARPSGSHPRARRLCRARTPAPCRRHVRVGGSLAPSRPRRGHARRRAPPARSFPPSLRHGAPRGRPAPAVDPSGPGAVASDGGSRRTAVARARVRGGGRAPRPRAERLGKPRASRCRSLVFRAGSYQLRQVKWHASTPQVPVRARAPPLSPSRHPPRLIGSCSGPGGRARARGDPREFPRELSRARRCFRWSWTLAS